jgi:hypothetical protein
MKSIKIGISLIAVIVSVTMLYFNIPVFGDSSDTTIVSATLTNRAPDVYALSTISAQDPAEGTTKTVVFNCSVQDLDGISEVTVVNATFYKATETNRTDSTCSVVETVNTTAKKYECSIDMQFYDTTGEWNYQCYAQDASSSSDTMSSTFTYNSLESWTMTPTSIGFGAIYLGGTDIGATDDPITLTNIGNHDFSGVIQVTALDLTGATNSTQYIPAGNFSVKTTDAHGGNAMVNNTAVTISSTSLPKGADSTEALYFYIEEVPSSGLSYQIYNTAGLGQWTISTA